MQYGPLQLNVVRPVTLEMLQFLDQGSSVTTDRMADKGTILFLPIAQADLTFDRAYFSGE
jgi:hypothetical protein